MKSIETDRISSNYHSYIAKLEEILPKIDVILCAKQLPLNFSDSTLVIDRLGSNFALLEDIPTTMLEQVEKAKFSSISSISVEEDGEYVNIKVSSGNLTVNLPSSSDFLQRAELSAVREILDFCISAADTDVCNLTSALSGAEAVASAVKGLVTSEDLTDCDALIKYLYYNTVLPLK